MTRQLVVGLLFAVAGAAHALGAQAPRGGASGAALDPFVSQALREQLSAGYDQRREPSGILQRLEPDRPIVRQLPLGRDALTLLAPSAGASRCPMPVATTDVRTIATMPVVRADSTRLEKMPVARPTCVNPLDANDRR
jgi:hypothetical protein